MEDTFENTDKVLNLILDILVNPTTRSETPRLNSFSISWGVTLQSSITSWSRP